MIKLTFSFISSGSVNFSKSLQSIQNVKFSSEYSFRRNVLNATSPSGSSKTASKLICHLDTRPFLYV